MAEATPNPFENTNSGPTAPAPNAPLVDAACCTAAKKTGLASRVLLYAPVALLFVGIVALWTVPSLANYASPILSLIDPSFGKSADKVGSCCSSGLETSTLEKTGSCCSQVSKAAMLTSSVSSDEISLESEGTAVEPSTCCSDEESLCPISLKGTSEEASGDEGAEQESDE